MLRLKDNFYKPVEDSILRLFWDAIYVPILAIVDIPNIKKNAVSLIEDAILSGKIQYKDGVFSGSFNARLSRELSTFAKFDRRSKTWKGNPGPSIKGASVLTESRRNELMARLQRAIDEAEARINQTIKTLSFGDDLPLLAMSEDIRKDLHSIGIMPELDERTMKKLRADYTHSQQLNIVNWEPEQIERLRRMVERIQTTSDNASIKSLIESEWHTSAAKAKFLARQETSLFFSKLSMNRASSAGVRRYRWSTSHDERVRESHKHLQGTIHAMDDPPIVDKYGRRAHPGQDFNCRCAAIWILE